MAERPRTLVDEIPLFEVLMDETNLLPSRISILTDRSKTKMDLKIYGVSVVNEKNRNLKIIKEKYEIKTVIGIFGLIHTLSDNSWQINSFVLSEE